MSKELEALKRIKEIKSEYYSKFPSISEELSIIETELILLNALRNKLNRKVETKEYKHEASNGYRIATLLTYELKEQWNDKELEALKQFLLSLSGIETKLKRLEKIDNALPLEIRDTDDLERFINASEKDREILRTIKEKQVAVDEFIRCCKEDNSLEEYNNFTGDENSLTQTEFDLLKEVLL